LTAQDLLAVHIVWFRLNEANFIRVDVSMQAVLRKRDEVDESKAPGE
jgi:hypothetical protein